MTIISEPLRIVDGIPCFTEKVPDDHNDYHTTGLDTLLSAEKEHFWFISRQKRIINTFLKHLPLKSRILEIGAGTAYVANGLQHAGYALAVGELHFSGLQYAKEKGIDECYQFDLFSPPFREEFDAIGMFDVLEHLEEDVHALQQVSKMLKPGGKLFITVPAHQWLWSRDDAIAAHKRRYSKKALVATVESAGLLVHDMQFFFISILPLLLLRRLLNSDRRTLVTEQEREAGIHIHPVMNQLLLKLTQLENHFSRWLPNVAGGSLFCVVKKH